MSDYFLGILVGVGGYFTLNVLVSAFAWWFRRRATRRFAAGMPDYVQRVYPPGGPGGLLGEVLARQAHAAALGAGQMSGLDLMDLQRAVGADPLNAFLETPEPPGATSDDVPEDPTDWLHVWKYVDGFAAFVKTFRGLSTGRPAEPRPVLSHTVNVYQYVAERPPYVGHPQVEEWLGRFASQIVQGFEGDLAHTLDEVTADLADCHAQLKALLERVGPPRKRSVAARLQGQINQVLDAAAKDRTDRRSVSEIKSTFGVGSFGGDPQPGSGPLG